MATIRTTGASLTNSVDINANSISLFDNTTNKYENIENVFVKDSHIMTAIPNESIVYEYPPDSINDDNISGLKSMIKYITTKAKRSSFNFGDNSNIIIKKWRSLRKRIRD